MKESNPSTHLSQIFVFLLLTIFLKIPSSAENLDTYPLPEDPLKGSRVFSEKGCIKCHAVWGMGESFGPDITKIGQEKDFYDLAGALWSHSPKMIDVMKEKEIPRPEFTPQETKDLMAYLYYLGFFDELGDHLKGEDVFIQKGCDQCHSLGGVQPKKGTSLDKYGRYVSPVFIATALWNHSSTVSEAMLEQSFDTHEMNNLLAYIRGNALNEKGETVYMRPGSPNKGKRVFGDKKCTACHGRDASDLKESPLRKSLTEIVGMMWNHSYQMWGLMKEKGVRIPRFDHEEMADLTTYLYFIPFYGEKGDPGRGKKTFKEKGCLSCHSPRAVEKGKGIDLREVSESDVLELIAAMWNHVPEMEKMVTEMNLVWPRFGRGEMKDLILYIRSLKK